MRYTYRTHGTCSQQITFDLDDQNTVHNVQFTGGCNGNLKAVSKLVDGCTAEEIVKKCEGITCGPRDTSCADQLAKAVIAAVREVQEHQD